MKFGSIILSLVAATTVSQAVPIPTHSDPSNEHCEDFPMADHGEGFVNGCIERWNHAVNACGLDPAPQPSTIILAEHKACLEAALKGFKASEKGVSPLVKRESDQDRQRREKEFRERRERAERERRERDDRERREREDRERREREQNNRDSDGKPTNVCTHDDWKNKRPCVQPS